MLQNLLYAAVVISALRVNIAIKNATVTVISIVSAISLLSIHFFQILFNMHIAIINISHKLEY